MRRRTKFIMSSGYCLEKSLKICIENDTSLQLEKLNEKKYETEYEYDFRISNTDVSLRVGLR